MRTLLRHGKRGLLAAAFALLALPAFGAQPEDAWITTRVKMALLTNDTVDGLAVDVDSVDGLVTLHGKVATPIEKTEAELRAREIAGVRDVRNLLSVVPEARREAVAISDQALREQVATVLDRDAALADSAIRVKSVNAGVIVLAGEAKTLSAHRRALEDARAVPGVRRVASEIRSPDQLGDEEIWQASDEPGTGIAAAASDAWITTRVKLRLMAEPGLSPFAVNVDTRDGVVTLFGAVPDAAAKARAATEARRVAGVKDVEDELQVVPKAAAERVEASDEQVRTAVRDQIDERAALDDADIDVAVENGVVRLTGTVATQRDRLTALTVARATTGVSAVIDDLELRTPQG